MFDFLNFFSSGVSIFATGASVLDTYANIRANKEKANNELWKQRHELRISQEQQRFDQSRVFSPFHWYIYMAPLKTFTQPTISPFLSPVIRYLTMPKYRLKPALFYI